MKRRIIFRHLQNKRYDSMDDMFEDIDIDIGKDIGKDKEEEIEKENGCFAGFLGFFRFFTNPMK